MPQENENWTQIIEFGDDDAQVPKLESLVGKICHRYKNHLSIISSSLRIAGSKTNNEAERLELESQDSRVRVLAALYNNPVDFVLCERASVPDLLRDTIVEAGFPANAFSWKGENSFVKSDAAAALGLLVLELVRTFFNGSQLSSSNLQESFCGHQNETNSTLVLEVSEGVDQHTIVDEMESPLIAAFTKQLGAHLKVLEQSKTIRIELIFPSFNDKEYSCGTSKHFNL